MGALIAYSTKCRTVAYAASGTCYTCSGSLFLFCFLTRGTGKTVHAHTQLRKCAVH